MMGDFGYSLEMEAERMKSILLTEKLGCTCFFKIRVLHGNEIKIVEPDGKMDHYLDCDGLIYFRTNGNQFPLLISPTADCPVVILTTEDAKFISIIHSGREGTFRKIVPRAFQLIRSHGINANDVLAGIWPGICLHHYEIPVQYRNYFPGHYYPQSSSVGKMHLAGAIMCQIDNERTGLYHQHKNTFVLDTGKFCSYHSHEHKQPLFFSYRRGDVKRNAVFVTPFLKAQKP